MIFAGGIDLGSGTVVEVRVGEKTLEAETVGIGSMIALFCAWLDPSSVSYADEKRSRKGEKPNLTKTMSANLSFVDPRFSFIILILRIPTVLVHIPQHHPIFGRDLFPPSSQLYLRSLLCQVHVVSYLQNLVHRLHHMEYA